MSHFIPAAFFIMFGILAVFLPATDGGWLGPKPSLRATLMRLAGIVFIVIGGLLLGAHD